MPNLRKEEKKNLYCAIDIYNDTITKNKVLDPTSDEDTRENLQIPELVGQNKSVNELFNQARNEVTIISDLSALYL